MTKQMPIPIWNIKTTSSGANVMNSYDFNKNGKTDLIIGRDNASIEL